MASRNDFAASAGVRVTSRASEWKCGRLLRVRSGSRTGAVTLIQRFGSALNLNIHLNRFFADGACTFEDERPRFHRVPAPAQPELQRLLHTIATRVTRTLQKQGLLNSSPDIARAFVAVSSQAGIDFEPRTLPKSVPSVEVSLIEAHPKLVWPISGQELPPASESFDFGMVLTSNSGISRASLHTRTIART